MGKVHQARRETPPLDQPDKDVSHIRRKCNRDLGSCKTPDPNLARRLLDGSRSDCHPSAPVLRW